MKKSQEQSQKNRELPQRSQEQPQLSSVILCGGKSSRMGEDKAGLSFAGETFLTHILGGISELDEVLISVSAAGLSKKASQSLERLAASGRIQLSVSSFVQGISPLSPEASEHLRLPERSFAHSKILPDLAASGESQLSEQSSEHAAFSPGCRTAGAVQPQCVRFVRDAFPDCGPMAGLHAALCHCRHPILFAVSCDMPYANAQTARQLFNYMTDEADAVVPSAADGRVHPLCALYRKSCADVFQEALRSREYRMRTLLGRLHVCYVPLAEVPELAKWVCNVNTREAYQEIISTENAR